MSYHVVRNKGHPWELMRGKTIKKSACMVMVNFKGMEAFSGGNLRGFAMGKGPVFG